MSEENKPYYLAYEERYKAVYAAGAENWGHSPDDATLIKTLTEWADKNGLQGKRVAEFACGEGACGVILSRLGCIYNGFDIAPSAVKKASAAVKEYPNASVRLADMVNEKPCEGELYDAALDVMGLHMLVTDSDRKKYLANVYASLKSGAPVLFFRESYRADAYEGEVATFADWCAVSGTDYKTPSLRRVMNSEVTVEIPLVPARAKNKNGYIAEMNNAGFEVDEFIEMDLNEQCVYSATIYAHKR